MHMCAFRKKMAAYTDSDARHNPIMRMLMCKECHYSCTNTLKCTVTYNMCVYFKYCWSIQNILVYCYILISPNAFLIYFDLHMHMHMIIQLTTSNWRELKFRLYGLCIWEKPFTSRTLCTAVLITECFTFLLALRKVTCQLHLDTSAVSGMTLALRKVKEPGHINCAHC